MFQRKLQQRGLINSVDDNDCDYGARAHHPNGRRPQQLPRPQQCIRELEMLQLIPLLIDELQADRIEAGERRMLRTLYGTLFELMEDEVVARSRHTDGDPVLADLLRALRRLEADGGRLVQRNGEKKDERFVNLWNRSDAAHGGVDEEPAQRILKLVAILIHANRGDSS